MKRIILIVSLLFQFWIAQSQEIKTTSISTNEILQYCKNKGGDSTLIKYNCSYLSLIDSSTCTYILNSIKGDYKQEPSYNTRKNSISQNDYLYLYNAREYFILNSSSFIKSQTLQDLVLEILDQTLKESHEGYIHETWDNQISSLIFQIKNTTHDTLLINIANKWREKSNDYDISKLSSFRINFPVIFTGDYSKKVGNYINCLENEKKYLLAYNSINSNNSDQIKDRILKIKNEIFDITQFKHDLKPEEFKDYTFNKAESKIDGDYKPDKNIVSLDKLDFKEYINNTVINQYTQLNLELIYNNEVGIMTKLLKKVNHKNQGYVHDMTDYIEIKKDGHIIVKTVSGIIIN